MGTAKDLTFDVLFPTEKCPECGKVFIRRCRRNEWGYWVRAGHGLILFCSSRCVTTYEDRTFMKEVKKVYESKPFAAYKLMKTKKMSESEARRIVGLKSQTSVPAMRHNKWKELEWLESHNWEVAE